ncbi:MAG TPA: TIGR03000 domain-containing protein [Gemmataceae bacterium]
MMPAPTPMPSGEMPTPGDGTILPPAGLGESIQPPGAPPTAPMPRLGEVQSSANQALFVVTLPGDARLLAEGREIPGQGAVRTFVSPPLEPGRDYYYDLAIEVDRGGKILRDQQSVRFQAGKTANVSFGEPKAETPPPPVTPPAPAKTTRIRVRIPDGAALYVEGRPWAVPVVQTPPLDPTRTHYYLLRVEVVRDGRRAVLTREVAFRAGQELTVDFTAPPPGNPAAPGTAAHVAKNSR